MLNIEVFFERTYDNVRSLFIGLLLRSLLEGVATVNILKAAVIINLCN
jgi:hypothetical protein